MKIFIEYVLDFDNNRFGFGKSVEVEDADVVEIRPVANAGKKLMSVDNVDAIISYWNIANKIVSEMSKGKNILHFGLGNDVVSINSKYDFLYYSHPKDMIRKMLAKADSDGVKKISYIGANDAWATMYFQALNAVKDEFGIEVVDDKFFNYGTKDYKLALTQMEMKISIPEGQKDFIKRVREHNKLDNTYGAAYIYDVASVIVDAYENAETKDKAVDVLENMQGFEGVTGKSSLENNFFRIKPIIKQIQNGQPVVIEE